MRGYYQVGYYDYSPKTDRTFFHLEAMFDNGMDAQNYCRGLNEGVKPGDDLESFVIEPGRKREVRHE